MTNADKYLQNMQNEELLAVFDVIAKEVEKREKNLSGLRKLLEMIRAEIAARGGRNA